MCTDIHLVMVQLNGDDGDDADEDDEETDQQQQLEDDDDLVPEQQPAEPPKKPSASASKKKKNKNKNKKGKGKSKNGNKSKQGSDDDDEDDNDNEITKKDTSADNGGLDEIDAAIAEINQKYGELPARANHDPSSSSQQQQPFKSQKHLLSIESKYLDADAELRRMFGSKVVQDELRQKRYLKSSGSSSRGGGMLVKPREEWPRIQGKIGVDMQMLQAPSLPNSKTDSNSESAGPRPGVFQYAYSSTYLEIQMMFMQCVNSNDPETLSNLVRVYPFHVDALLQVSEIMKHNGNMNQAHEMIGNCSKSCFLYFL
jgi:hypothetical protein